MSNFTLLDRRLELWLGSASAAETSAGMVLSCALTSTPSELAADVKALWSIDEGALGSGPQALLQRPFVHATADGVRIEPALKQLISDSFERIDANRFSAAHTRMATRERTRQAANPLAQWAQSARVAYYLAPIDVGGAANQFKIAFSRPPRSFVDEARQWLVSLVMEQSRFMQADRRTFEFYSAFRDYRKGFTGGARRGFAAVLSDDPDARDEYAAISSHLLGVIDRDEDYARDLLDYAVTLSQELGLVDNEIMSRNSLIYAYFRANDWRLADEAARENWHLARRHSPGSGFDAWTQLTMIQARYRHLEASDAAALEAESESLASSAIGLVEKYRKMNDLEGEALATNAAVQILLEMNRIPDALNIASKYLDHRDGLGIDTPSTRRLGQTLGQYARVSLGSSHVEVRRILQRLNAGPLSEISGDMAF